MSLPAARITDMHVCPMMDGPKPHIGGPILGPGVAQVLIGGIPAAVVGDQCTCAGPPDIIIKGSTNVLIGGKPAARMSDTTAHGGTIMAGCPTVLIGNSSSSAGHKQSFNGAQNLRQDVADSKRSHNESSLKQAAERKQHFANRNLKEDYSAQYQLLDGSNKPLSNVDYEIKMNDGKLYKGKTDQQGKTQKIDGYTVGNGTIAFKEKDN